MSVYRRDHRLAVGLIVLLTGCKIVGDGKWESLLDPDGDGLATSDDCDDLHALGVEIPYDGLDNDCDPGTPDDDLDGDGFQSAADCDDQDASVYPDAAETCDGLDDDCDSEIDEDDAVDASIWYADGDADGYGVAESTTVACEQPDGYAGLTGDCADGDATINPGIGETPYNGGDDDCDDATPDDDLDGDGYDASVDCDDEAPDVHPDAAVICDDGLPSICDDATEIASCRLEDDDLSTAAVLSLTGTAASAILGWALTGVGEEESGGSPYLVVGAPGTSTDAGAVYVLAYPGPGSLTLPGTAPALTLSGSGAEQAGVSLDASGDLLESDGHLLVGAYTLSDEDSNVGAAYLLSGPLASDGALSDLYTTRLMGETAEDRVGFAVALGEDDSGAALLAVGTPFAGGESDDGAVYVLDETVTGDVVPADVTRLTGAQYGEGVGSAVAWGDLDDDGHLDLIIGSAARDTTFGNEGAVYVVYGPVSDTFELGGPETGAILRGNVPGAQAGRSVSGGPDVDGDGNGDLLIGGPQQFSDTTSPGLAWLVYGPVSGTIDLPSTESASSDPSHLLWTGSESGDLAGISVSIVGDLDADGMADLLTGANGASPAGDAYADQGAAYVLYGPPSGSGNPLSSAGATLRGVSGGDGAGHAVAAAGDVDGDGYADFLVGAYNRSAGATVAVGAAYLVRGGGY